jgi:hypothetical protein
MEIEEQKHMRIQRWIMPFVVVLVVLTSCGVTSSRSDRNGLGDASGADSHILRAQGYWEGRAGDIHIASGIVGDIYHYDWYAIDITSPTRAIVAWDDGHTCRRTEAEVQDNEVRLSVRGVDTVFVIHDETTATVTFRRGEETWVKQLEKARVNPQVTCG